MLHHSILDSDFYKFSMQYFAWHFFPNEKVIYKLIIRKPRIFPKGFYFRLRESIDSMRDLQLSQDEYSFFKDSCPYFEITYLQYLLHYRYNPDEVEISQTEDTIDVTISGYWHSTILWEVPIMFTISELFFENSEIPKRNILHNINVKKAKLLADNGVLFADMGSRRRFSFKNHDEVLEDFTSQGAAGKNLIGTSNPYFAMKYNIKLVGTKAHELYALMAAIYGFPYANTIALEKWYELYKGNLSIALPDTFTTNSFLHSFDYRFAKLYDGIRQDSGDPKEFAIKFFNHYKMLGIDPKSKTFLFSDSLNAQKAIHLNNWMTKTFDHKCSVGIGTFFTCNIPGVEPLNMVIKLVGRIYSGKIIPVIKLSDDISKSTGNSEMVKLCKQTFNMYLRESAPTKTPICSSFKGPTTK